MVRGRELGRRHLQRLLGQGDDVAVASERRAEAFAAWRRFLEALGELGPAVLVFEDLHWADDGMLDFVDHLVEWAPGVPLLVVGTARPELLERRPGWGGGKPNAPTLALSPLSDEETARLIAALAEQPLLAATTQQGLLARAEGNPLYAEQYVRMRPGALRRPSCRCRRPCRASLRPVSTVSAPDEKSLMQDAAVLGKVFWAGAAAALGDDDPHGAAELLHGLERKEFVQRARRSSVAGETEYSFRHVLVRDVAYAQIPRAERAEKHRRAADWIETLGRPEDHAEMVAHHYVSALEALPSAAGARTCDGRPASP